MEPLTRFLASALVGLALAVGAHAQAPSATTGARAASGPAGPGGSAERRLDVTAKVAKGDFDVMLERRSIRFYLPYSRSLYFLDKGQERGVSADLIREFERWVNKKYASKLGKRPLTVFAVVATRDSMLADLLEGQADVAVGNI